MGTVKKVKVGIVVVLIVFLALFFHFNLPRTAVVQVSGTDVKRVDQAAKAKEAQAETAEQIAQQTADVRFINAKSRDGKPMVFRNEDTGWGWPPYFKFDSADLTAEAQAFAADPSKPWVLVKYYGWRIKVFSMFPNALSLKAVDRNYSHFPLFNIAFFVILIAVVLYIRAKLKKFVSRLRNRKGSDDGVEKNS